MSNSISSTSISALPRDVMQHIFSFDLQNHAYVLVNRQFRGDYTDLLRQNIERIFRQCSACQTPLFINILKERCQIIGGADVNKMYQLIVQKIKNFGIACPNKYLSPQEIHEYSAAIEDRNLQKTWGVIRQAVIAEAPAEEVLLNPPAENASADIIRAWMDMNAAALQHIHELYLSNRRLTCMPREIALLTGLQRLYPTFRGSPQGEGARSDFFR